MSDDRRILIVDADPRFLAWCGKQLGNCPLATTGADSVECAERLLGVRDYEVLVASADLAGNQELQFIRRVAAAYPHLGLLVIAEPNTTAPAVDAVGLPLSGYLVKPFTATRFCEAVMTACEQSRMSRQILALCQGAIGAGSQPDAPPTSAGDADRSKLPAMLGGIQRLVRSRDAVPGQLCSSGGDTQGLARARELMAEIGGRFERRTTDVH